MIGLLAATTISIPGIGFDIPIDVIGLGFISGLTYALIGSG